MYEGRFGVKDLPKVRGGKIFRGFWHSQEARNFEVVVQGLSQQVQRKATISAQLQK
jgi:hypothetical protein